MASASLAPVDELGIFGVAFETQTDIHKCVGRELWSFRYLQAKAYFKNIGRAIVKGPSTQQNVATRPSDTWKVPIDLSFGRKDEYKAAALALFDSQSWFDLISTKCAARLGLNFNNAAKAPFARTITGSVVHKVGEFKARFYCLEVVRSSFSKNEIECRPMVEEIRFLVVDSELFDVIIGHPTMERLNIYGRKQNLVAPFRPLDTCMVARPTGTAAQQSAADKAIEEERLRMEQDEAQRAQASAQPPPPSS